MKTQKYHTQDGAIHYGYAHKPSLALIDLIAEAKKRLDSQVTPEGARGIAKVYETINALYLAARREGKMSRYIDINAGRKTRLVMRRDHTSAHFSTGSKHYQARDCVEQHNPT